MCVCACACDCDIEVAGWTGSVKDLRGGDKELEDKEAGGWGEERDLS